MMITWNAVPHKAANIHDPGPFCVQRTAALVIVLATISMALTPITTMPTVAVAGPRTSYSFAQWLLIALVSTSNVS
jgi:hypothetical protein